jgi:hypothetical protein
MYILTQVFKFEYNTKPSNILDNIYNMNSKSSFPSMNVL